LGGCRHRDDLGRAIMWKSFRYVACAFMTETKLGVDTCIDGDPIFCSHNNAPEDRAATLLKAHNASRMCVEFCDDWGVLNDLYLWLLYENMVVYCAMHTRGSQSFQHFPSFMRIFPGPRHVFWAIIFTVAPIAVHSYSSNTC
jgi:hypothetical protein